MKRSPAILATLLMAAITCFFLIPEKKPGGVVPESDGTKKGMTAARTGGRGAVPPWRATTTAEAKLGDRNEVAALPRDFLERVSDGDVFRFRLPDEREIEGRITLSRRDEHGILFIQGTFEVPEKGRFFFQRQTSPGVAGALAGCILFEGKEDAWKVEPSGPDGSPMLVRTNRDGVVCVNYRMPPPEQAAIEKIPEAHPTDIPIPDYQDILPLQSLPGAVGVIYLDFDGEQGPFPGWGEFDAAAPGVSNAQVHEVWKMVCEDFQGFNLNITTDRKVFDRASPGRRQHVVVTPTVTASPEAGGVALLGSYNWSTSTVCWAFYSTGKYCAEVISHEVGHTLGLSHDGRTMPAEDYYYGHGSGETGWAPIMGAGYVKNLTQWSKGEYAGANRTQDDLALITSNNNVAYRSDDVGDDEDGAKALEIFPDGSVVNEGIIERGSDVDCFRFVTGGGPVELHVSPVTSNPNLDVLAELVDAATGNYLLSVNPEAELDATISTTLPPGEYLLEISGVGMGDPAGEGYSDYGSLGSYVISGSIPDGEKPDRLSVAENLSSGSPVGTIAPRRAHGTAALSWSIISGNTGGTFDIDAGTGELKVGNAGALNYESLSSRWDDPATIELEILISNPDNPALNETIRVVVTIDDVNEAPALTAANVTILEKTRPGTPLHTMVWSDVDRFDQPSFSIVSGNEDGKFVIDPGSGVVSVSEAGVGEVTAAVEIPLLVRVADQAGAITTASLVFTVIDLPEGLVPGGVMRAFFEGIPGSSVTSLTNASSKWPDYPDKVEFLRAFDGGEHGDNFGSSVSGYFIPPVSGSYRFWIASDGSSQLSLDTTTEQSGASVIASVNGGTDSRQWLDSTPNRSQQVSLVAGIPYFIEALHKESTGADHISVAFSGPGIPKQLLGGRYLAPSVRNYAPKVADSIFAIEEHAFAGQKVGRVSASDPNAGDTIVSYAITAGDPGGIFSIDAATGVVRLAKHGAMDSEHVPSYTLIVEVSDGGSPAMSASGEVTINVLPEGCIVDRGLLQQIWNGIPGSDVASLLADGRFPLTPSVMRFMVNFDSGESRGDDYGSRIRALVTPSTSGYHTFYLSSNDDSILYLGSNASEIGALAIASVEGSCLPNEWSKYATQQSAPVYLEAGTDYYIETLHKDGTGDDHVQVGWTTPESGVVSVIPGTSLKPYDFNQAPVFPGATVEFQIMQGVASGTILGTVAAQDPELEIPIHAILSGNEAGAFSINPVSGVLSISDGSFLTAGRHVLVVGAQDLGVGGILPLKTASITVEVVVASDNLAPAFALVSDSMFATEDDAFSGQVLASDPDAGDVLTFSKISGPEWLEIGEEGVLGGTPGNGDVGFNEFVLKVADGEGLFDEMSLSIIVENVNDAPVFPGPSFDLQSAIQGESYLASLGGSAVDVDEGDSLAYSKIAGPEWLSIAHDGTLSGVPGSADPGDHEVTVRATDEQGAYSEAVFAIHVVNVNDPPVFATSVISLPQANEDESYAGALSGLVIDPDAGDSLIFSKVSGSPWLSVSASGVLGGVPANADVGTNVWIIRVTDAAGAFSEASVTLEVINVNDAPAFHSDPILAAGAKEEVPYSDPAFATVAYDEDAGDTVSYSKIAGQGWLDVSAAGVLSGSPPAGSAGLQTFTVRATDIAGAYTDAVLLIEVTTEHLPLPWESMMVGSSSVEGSTAFAETSFIVTGGGELASRADSFQYVWQPLTGDGSITARVDSMTDTGLLSKAGVMIRDTLAANSRHVFMGVTGSGSYRWVRRTGFNGNTSSNSSGNAVFPNAWLRLTRSGSVITAFKSTDGNSWTQIGSLSADFPATCYFGLAVASGSPTLPDEARFSNVSISP